mgnify:CR=1 FL=1
MRGWFRGRISSWSVGAVMFGLMGGLGGCGTDSFAPPPPDELRSVLAPAQPTPKSQAGAKPIEVILAPRDSEAATSSAHFARTQAGFDGTLLHIEAPTLETTPAGQADLVAKAAQEKPPALIVEQPEKPDPKLAKVIEEARSSGIPVVLIGPKLEGVDESPATKDSASRKARLTRVESVPFDETAKQIVKSVVRVVKNARLDPKGKAVLVYTPSGDPYTAARVSAIKAALTEAGVTDQISFVFPVKADEGVEALKSDLKKDPKITIVIPFDYRSFMGAFTATNEFEGGRQFVLAGYNSEERSPFLYQIDNLAAAAEFRTSKLIRRAVQLAPSLIRGEKVDPVNSVSITFTDSPPTMGIPELKKPKQKVEGEVGYFEKSFKQ